MNAFQEEYRYMTSGDWAAVNPSKCPCSGIGWLLSDLDSWHRCPKHGAGLPHPEDESDAARRFDFAAHRLEVMRGIFLHFWKETLYIICDKNETMRRIRDRLVGNTMQDYINAAEEAYKTAEWEYRCTHR